MLVANELGVECWTYRKCSFLATLQSAKEFSIGYAGNSKTNVHECRLPTYATFIVEFGHSEQPRQLITVPYQQLRAAVDVSSDAEVEQAVVERRFHVLFGGTARRQHVRNPLREMSSRRVTVYVQLFTQPTNNNSTESAENYSISAMIFNGR